MSAPTREYTFASRFPALAVLSSTEMMERFSFYGMRALLVLYLMAPLLAKDGSGPGLGMDRASATAVYGSYLALVYLTPLIGGWFADRLIGARTAVLIGGIVIAVGHFTMATPTPLLFWVGLLLIALGTGFLKPNISAMVGDLYPGRPEWKDAGFNVFYMGINAGGFFAPLLTAAVAMAFGWHWGFLVAGIAMTLALVVYVAGWRTFSGVGTKPAHPVSLRQAAPALSISLAGIVLFALIVVVHSIFSGFTPALVAADFTWAVVLIALVMMIRLQMTKGLGPTERSRLRLFAFLFAGAIIFFMIFDQAGSVMNSFAEDNVDRHIAGFEMSAAWLQSLNPLFIIIFAPIFAFIWARLAAKAPSIPLRFAMGIIGIGISFLIMAIPGAAADSGAASAIWWLVLVYLIQTWAELLVSPIGLSASTQLAPPGMSSQVLALWFLAISVGDALGGQVYSYIGGLGMGSYFAILGGIALVFGVAAAFMSPRLARLMA